jgi:hypothetical protein
MGAEVVELTDGGGLHRPERSPALHAEKKNVAGRRGNDGRRAPAQADGPKEVAIDWIAR